MKKYDVIYADPPWKYRHSRSYSRRVERHYPTMSLRDICRLKVPAKENAVLYLWATAPKLRAALRVMRAWGFEYKTHMVWDKIRIGLGYWFRGQHELLLVGVRGKFSPPKPGIRVESIQRWKRTDHSVKPPQVRELIERWFPDVARLEMFARDRAPGWDVWGNAIKGLSPAAVDRRDQEASTGSLFD